MAVSKLWAVKSNLGKVIDYANNPKKTRNPKYTEEQYQALADVIAYAKDEEKTEKQFFVEGINCNPVSAREQFVTTKQFFGQTDGIQGAKSISILEPVDFTRTDGTQGVSYNVKKVFDVSQTNGKRPSSPTVNRDPQNLIKIMLRTAPVNFESVDDLTDPNAVAFYDNDRNTLLVKRHVNNSVALFQGVALELGYAELSTRSESFSRKDMSYQAVCVGYMICKKYGVEAKSFAIDRIPAQWKDKEPKEVRAELSKMRTAMSDIHSRVSEEIYRQQQERSVDRSR